MANYNIKYTVQYQNIEGDSFLLEILKKGTWKILPLEGSVVHRFKNVSDVFEPIRASHLQIDLEASTDNLLLDFANIEEFDFKVKFYRNNEQLFEGWINPDGYFQDWVNDKWIISLQAVDGLATLRNLEFSNLYENIPVNPKETSYLFLILERLGYSLPITIADDINFLEWHDLTVRLIDVNVFINRNNNFLDCETVLKDLLQKYNLTISQAYINGRFCWYICRVYYGLLPNNARKNIAYNHEIIYNKDLVYSGVIWQILTEGRLLLTEEEVESTIFFDGVKVGDVIELFNAGQNNGFYDVDEIINNTSNGVVTGQSLWLIKQQGTPIGQTTNITVNKVKEVIISFNDFSVFDSYPKNKVIISDINSETSRGFDAIHCNQNQSLQFEPALQNFRFETDWLGSRNFLKSMMEEFTPTPVALPATFTQNGGLFFRRIQAWSTTMAESQTIQIDTEAEGDIAFEFDITRGALAPYEGTIRFDANVIIEFEDPNSGELLYLTRIEGVENSEVLWDEEFHIFRILGGRYTFDEIGRIVERGGKRNIFKIFAPKLNGNYRIYIQGPSLSTFFYGSSDTIYHSVKLSIENTTLGIGATYDTLQPTKRSTFLSEPIKIINSNEPEAIFTNNLYKSVNNELLPMTFFKATAPQIYADLLELTSRERVRLKQNPQKVFRGDIYGFIPYQSVVSYDGINGFFVITSYSYDTARNIIQLECKQIFNSKMNKDFKKSYIFENEKNVLIK